jgi:hypothetical protein
MMNLSVAGKFQLTFRLTPAILYSHELAFPFA